MKVLVTGGCGLIGFHVSKFYAEKGHFVHVLDNLERSKLLGHEVSEERAYFNYNLLSKMDNVKVHVKDVSDKESFRSLPEFDYIVHLAAQCGVPTSIKDPVRDFQVNTVGTLNVLEHARTNRARVVYASTNKVYPLHGPWKLNQETDRWEWDHTAWKEYGYPLDGHVFLGKRFLGSRTPYGTSKYAGDLLCQEYWHTYQVPTGVFRMSCIYGDHQFGFEEQGWATWFAIATLKGLPINIYGDGRQVRDMLWVEDVVQAYNAFLSGDKKHGVWNLGGGPDYTVSLNECLLMLEKITGKMSKISFKDWRPSDQRIYTSDIRPVMEDLNWTPTHSPKEGLSKIVDWASTILDVF